MNLSNDTYAISGHQRHTKPIGAWLFERVRQLRATWAQRRAWARQMQELSLSSDRELRDMGLSRSDVREIARGTYRRD